MQVPAQLYNDIFLTTSSVPELTVNSVAWNEVHSSLPKDFRIPDIDVIGPVLETYRRMLEGN